MIGRPTPGLVELQGAPMAARPRALAYVGNEYGTSASWSTRIPAAIAVAATCASSTARSPTMWHPRTR